MDSAWIDAYLVATGLDTASVASYFRVRCGKGGTLVLGPELRDALRSAADGKLAVLYTFGAVTLVNFNNVETRSFLHFLASLGQTIDEAQFARYADNYSIGLGPGLPWLVEMDGARVADDLAGCTLSTCDTMALSLLYERLDERIGVLSDRGEELVAAAGSGRLFHVQSHVRELAGFLRFQADYAHSCDERSWKAGKADMVMQPFRVALQDFYDIRGRADILGRKSEGLGAIIDTLTEHSVRRQELRVWAVQALLILSFVVLDIVYYF